VTLDRFVFYVYFVVSIRLISVKEDSTAVIDPNIEVRKGMEVKYPKINPLTVEATNNCPLLDHVNVLILPIFFGNSIFSFLSSFQVARL